MHPILKRRSRLMLYLGVWIVFGLLLAVVFVFGGHAPAMWSLEFAVPLAVLLGLQSLSFWYLVQSMQPGDTPIVRLALDWLATGVVSLACGSLRRTRGRYGCCPKAGPIRTNCSAHSPC